MSAAHHHVTRVHTCNLRLIAGYLHRCDNLFAIFSYEPLTAYLLFTAQCPAGKGGVGVEVGRQVPAVCRQDSSINRLRPGDLPVICKRSSGRLSAERPRSIPEASEQKRIIFRSHVDTIVQTGRWAGGRMSGCAHA